MGAPADPGPGAVGRAGGDNGAVAAAQPVDGGRRKRGGAGAGCGTLPPPDDPADRRALVQQPQGRVFAALHDLKLAAMYCARLCLMERGGSLWMAHRKWF